MLAELSIDLELVANKATYKPFEILGHNAGDNTSILVVNLLGEYDVTALKSSTGLDWELREQEEE